MRPKHILLILLVGLGLSVAQAKELRVGIVGLDTSHCVNWTSLLNDPQNKDYVPGVRVVAAYKGGSDDIASSYTRVDRFAQEMQEKWGVELVPTIEELCRRVDAVMLLSGDGRKHLEQARPILAAGKPVFIDKPIAHQLRDAIQIFDLAQQQNVPIFSASGFRFLYGGASAVDSASVGEIRGAASHGPAPTDPSHQDLFWYGIHPTEGLFTYLGNECEKVVRVATPDTDLVVGVWSGGRVGTLRGIRNASAPYGVTVYGKKRVIQEDPQKGYVHIVREIVKFFQTGKAPVAPEDTLAVIAFMEAAEISKKRGGGEVYISDVFAAARKAASF